MKKSRFLNQVNPLTLSRRDMIKRVGALSGVLLTGYDNEFYKLPIIRGG